MNYISDDFGFEVKETLSGLDVYDIETSELICSLDGYTLDNFTYDGVVDDSKIYDAVREEEDWQEYVSNMATYGSPT
jgi:hypothetical protein